MVTSVVQSGLSISGHKVGALMPSLTPFQVTCRDRVVALFCRHGVEADFEVVTRTSYAPGPPGEEAYLVSTARVGRSKFTCYIYDDEAGYDQGDVIWKIFESPDFEDEESLIRAFVTDLDSAMAEASVSVDPGPAFRPLR